MIKNEAMQDSMVSDNASENKGEVVNTFKRLLDNCYRDVDGSPYIFDQTEKHGSKIILLDEKSAVDFYRHECFKDQGGYPKKKDAKEDVDNLRLQAKYERPVFPIKYRTQSYLGNGIEIKLDARSSVKITKVDIKIGQHYGHFWNTDHEESMVEPDLSGSASIEPFLDALGIVDSDSRILLTGLMLIYLHYDVPYPMLVIKGPHGSGKTTLSVSIKDLIDPSQLKAIAEFGSPRDVYVAADQCHVLSFDNVSDVPEKMCDTHCTIATGAQRAERKLFTNKEMSYVSTQNPQVFNGIPNIFNREDFRERAILIEMPVIETRKTVAEFKQVLKSTLPKALGHLMKAMQVALQNLDNTPTPQGLRMADAARLVTAAESAFGWESGAFVAAYERNQLLCIEQSMSDEPVYLALLKHLKSEDGLVQGTATQIWNNLYEVAKGIDSSLVKSKQWPKSAAAFTAKLNRLEGTLSVLGIRIRQQHMEYGKRLTIYDENDFKSKEQDFGLKAKHIPQQKKVAAPNRETAETYKGATPITRLPQSNGKLPTTPPW